MNIIAKTLRQHLSIIKNNIPAVLLALLSVAVVIYYGVEEKRILHVVGYLVAVWLGAFITDLVVNLRPIEAIGFPIKRPVKKEMLLITICTVLGIAFLFIRFFGGWESMKPLLRLALMPLILFTFPVVLGVVYLFVYKYKPKELGINLNYWYLPIILHIMWGCITIAVAADRSHWIEGYKEFGFLGMLWMGFFTAALSEEFFRMLMQTRLGKFMNNRSLAFVITSMIWGMMHIPIFLRDHPETSLTEVTIASLSIVPIGLFWGYLTYRTKSMIPAIVMHGLNLWGLQNL